MRAPERVVVVGAGLAGARCAETLRAEGFAGPLTVVGAEPWAPYERPALSKALLAGEKRPADLTLRPPGWLAERGIALLTGRRAVRVDPRARTVTLEDGHELAYGALVLATGARARRLPVPAPAGVHRLRTLDDALALRDELAPGSRLAVVGAGFVGGEVATTARRLGVDVTVVDPAPPLARVLGRSVAEVVAARYAEEGIGLVAGTVASLRAGADGRVRAVELAGGAAVPCDAVLVAIGAEAAVELLPQAARLDGGLATDELGRTSVPGVYACGDVATTRHPALGLPLRVEHWTSAAGQAAAVARTLLGRAEPYREPPYVWSDQLGLRLQLVGRPAGAAQVELEGEPGSFAARYRDAAGATVAVLAANRPHELGALRRELASVATRRAA